MLPKPYLSPSQINMYLRCPAAYKYRYVDGLILPPKAALTRGKSVHRGQEHNYNQKINTLTDVKLSEVQEVTAAEFESLEAETDWENNDKGKVKDESISLASLYHQEVAPTVQPVLVEQKIEVKLPNTDISILGFIDLVDNDGFIRDTKTASKTPSESEVIKSLQLSAYSMAYRDLMGMQEAGVKLDYLVATKTPKVVTLTAQRSDREIERFANIAKAVANAISKGVYFAAPGNMLCSEKNCGFWSKCHIEF